MHLTAWSTLAILAVYFWTGFNAGRARVTYKISAPEMDGPAPFLAAQRVQTNTLEQLPLVQKGSRLSVMPVTAEQWAAVLALR